MNTAEYTEYRNWLLPVARRIVGNAEDAEDLVQESLLRWHTQDQSRMANPKGYLIKSLINRCLNFVRDRRRLSREAEGGPEAAAAERSSDGAAISLGMWALMEKLSPLERAVFILKEVFSYAHQEIAELLGISEEYCRQILLRARRHLKDEKRKFPVAPERQEALLRSFVRVIEGGSLSDLLRILKEDIEVEISRPAAALPATRLQGRVAAAEYLLAMRRLGIGFELLWLKELPALVAYLYCQPLRILQVGGGEEGIERIEVRELERVAQPA
jgi:RNA polymerase sigma-70 factor (ECF subfamily)